MTKKEITICGKTVTLAYCFATEISYKILSDEDITQFMQDCIAAVQEETMPDTRRSIYAILAAMSAYYESVKQPAPLTDEDLMFNASPLEIVTALVILITLRAEFYHIPSSEPKDKEEGDGSKN